jgi:prepilin-type N-terminal cleavage/methylation domain-containing protein
MSRRKTPKGFIKQAGFTIVEMTVVMAVGLIVALTTYTIFNTLLNQYFGLQEDGTEFTDLATQSQRMATVIRGLTDIVSASNDDLTAYAYFSPNDAYVSQVHYYLNAQKTTLYADVTPMTANPPIGTLITGQKKTHTIIDDYHPLAGLNLFTYMDATNTVLSVPLADEHAVKTIQINLAVPAEHPTPNGYQQMSLQLSLRNRKTNL